MRDAGPLMASPRHAIARARKALYFIYFPCRACKSRDDGFGGRAIALDRHRGAFAATLIDAASFSRLPLYYDVSDDGAAVGLPVLRYRIAAIIYASMTHQPD